MLLRLEDSFGVVQVEVLVEVLDLDLLAAFWIGTEHPLIVVNVILGRRFLRVGGSVVSAGRRSQLGYCVRAFPDHKRRIVGVALFHMQHEHVGLLFGVGTERAFQHLGRGGRHCRAAVSREFEDG